MRTVAQLSVLLVSALLYGWCFPPAPQRWLAWFALVPLLMILRRQTAARAVLFAWVWTVAMAYTVNDWFPRAVSGYFAQPFALGIGLFLAVSTFTAALQYMAFALAYRRLATLGPVVTPYLAAAAWVAADLARLSFLGGDPWALLGYSQVGVLPLVQVADLAGVHAVTFVMVAINAALAELWCAAPTRRFGPSLAGAGLAILALVATLSYGEVRLRGGAVATQGPSVPVGVVQAHLPLGSQWRRDFYGRNLETYLRLSHDLLRQHGVRLLIWPETAMTFFLADEPAYRRAIASVIQPFGAELVAGGPYTDTEESQYLNSAFVLSPDGDILARYDKRLLLPFAEYFPFRLDILRRSFGRVREFTPGDGPTVLDTVAGPAGIVICNEGFFPEPAAARVRAGATVLINLANDSWLADPKFSEPAFDMVTLRAVEQRRWIIRASTAGPSALIDPFGRVTERSPLLQAATVIGAVEPREGITVYGRVGDVFAWLCVVVTGIAWLAARRRREMPATAFTSSRAPSAPARAAGP